MEKNEFEKIINEHGNALLNYCSYLTLDKELAAELYQETLLKAFQIGGKLSKSSNQRCFLLGVATNIWKNLISKKMRRNRIAPVTDYEEHKEKISNSDNVLDKIIERELINEVQKAVDRLPDKQRVVILLYYMQKMSTSDIASVLHIPKGTVLSRLAKARESLRKEMEERGYEI